MSTGYISSLDGTRLFYVTLTWIKHFGTIVWGLVPRNSKTQYFITLSTTKHKMVTKIVLVCLSFLLPFSVYSDLHTNKVNGVYRVNWQKTRKNYTFFHEAWQPIHFPSAYNKVTTVDLNLEEVSDGGNFSTVIDNMVCSGYCAIAEREQNYTLPEVQDLLAFESATDDGTVQLTNLKPEEKMVKYLNQWLVVERFLLTKLSGEREYSHSRKRRSIVGSDTRFLIDDRKFMAKEPFSAAVKLSTGCSGVLIGERYVLTAARCIHNGKRYVTPIKRLNVGFRRNRSLKSEEIGTEEWERALIWVRVAKAFLPFEWTNPKQYQTQPLEKDYAVLLLKRGPERPHLNISVGSAVNVQRSAQLHMNALDTPNSAEFYYRFCSVQGETAELLYQQCDGGNDAVGAGIYVRRWDGRNLRWTRKVIGVYIGQQSYNVDGRHVSNNLAIRITPLKFAQICYWLTGDYNQCNGWFVEKKKINELKCYHFLLRFLTLVLKCHKGYIFLYTCGVYDVLNKRPESHFHVKSSLKVHVG